MIYYLDTSVCISALVSENASQRVLDWFTKQDVNATIAVSEWVCTEFAAALARKVREGITPAREQSQIQATFFMVFGKARFVAITDQEYRTAARFAAVSGLGLRAGDALHLAISATDRATLCTLDKKLAGAGPQLGVSTLLL